MAIVSAGWQLTVELLDGTGVLGTKTVDLQATDQTEATAAATDWIAKFMATTDLLLAGYRISEVFTENAVGALPAVTVLHSVTASISAAILDLPFKFASLVIPAPKIGVFSSTTGRGANIVNPTATIVQQLLTEYTEGQSAYISDREFLDPVFNASGRRVTRYRRLGNN